MNDTKKSRIFDIGIRYGVHILFVISIFLTVRWSDFPSPNNKILNVLFVHNNNVDAAALNTVTGYITGYIVYVLTVYIPEVNKKRPVRALVMERLAIIYQKSVYILLLMCKNCCTNEEEWRKIIKSSDIECFNELFYTTIKTFDITSEADTIFFNKEDNCPLKWYEYLSNKYEAFFNELNTLFVQYQYYLQEEDIEIIELLKNSNYFDAFLGQGNHLSILVHDSEEGYGYYEDMPICMAYSQPKKISPIFADNKSVENSRMLKEYVEILKRTYKYLKKYKNKYNIEVFHEDFACSKLKEEKIGHLGKAIFK